MIPILSGDVKHWCLTLNIFPKVLPKDEKRMDIYKDREKS